MPQLHDPHAPYTFVPLSRKVLVRYQSPEEVPGHDVFDPELKTGEIHVTLTAETPVFISDGGEDPHFFRGPDGQYMIPGSTLRGMTRENMEILGFGLFRPGEDFEDRRLFFRVVAASSASVEKGLNGYYRGALGISSPDRGRDGKSFSVPEKVQAGYLCNEGGKFLIRPVKGGHYIRIPRTDEVLARDRLADGEAVAVPVAYSAGGKGVTYICRSDDPVPGLLHGKLLYTGKAVGRPNARYLFPDPDMNADPIGIPDEDRIAYEEDLEFRQNTLGDPTFWTLPEPGDSKPVFYITYDGHIYFGMSLFLRIGYKNSLQQGLPRRHRDLLNQGGEVMDYPRAVLGYAGANGSMRSRVSFGDCPVYVPDKDTPPPVEMPPFSVVLGEPKPSWYVGYSEGGKHYGRDDFQLAGRKQYWLRKAEAAPALKENVKSVMRPLPEGTVFRGVIRYRNLHEDELGLLLWSLRLNEDCRQSIGMGKPYGYGRMKLTVDQLLEYSPETLYSEDGLCCGPSAASEQTVRKYISACDGYICRNLHFKPKSKKEPATIASQKEIRDFFGIRSKIQSGPEFTYMSLDEYRNPSGCLKTASEILSGGEKKDESGSGSMSLQELAEKINSHRL